MISKCLLSLSLIFSASIFSETITFRADNWCPFNCEPNSKEPGYAIEILEATLGKAGHKIDYQILAWNRAILETAEGKHNAIIAASVDDLKGGKNSEPIGLSKSCFFVKNESNFKYENVTSLKGKKIAVIKDYKYGTDVDDDIAKRPDGYEIGFGEDPLTLNIRKLEAGRVDAVIENDTVFNYTASKEKLGSKFKPAGCLPDEPLFISFNSKDPKNLEYIKIINKGIDELRKSGELKKILDKYNAKDWK